MFDATYESRIPQASCRATPSGGLRLYAPAKINLNLLVGPLRRDGYHPVDSCIAKITLYDRIELQARKDGTITLTCEGFPCGPVEENLAYRAAGLLAEGRDVPGVDIRLTKHIPPGGGLGGGSSDAAGGLAGLNQLWNLGLSDTALHAQATELGSDVPLFLGPPSCRATGRGEILEPIDVFPFWAVLILPELHCPTPDVYRTFDAQPTPQGKPLDTGILAQPPSRWRDQLVNHLSEAASAVCPALGELHRRVTNILPLPVCLSGSGSSLFVLCDDQDEAQRILKTIPPDVQECCGIVRKNAW